MPSPKPDYILDLSSSASPKPHDPAAHPSESFAASTPPAPGSGPARPFLSVHWKCCQTYSRIYRNAAKTAYIGHCPTCGKKVTATIAQGGVDTRFFTAY